VVIGNNCRVQNLAQIFNPATIHDGVFIGPGAILTNDKYPRATDESGQGSNVSWVAVPVVVMSNASIGAGAICVAPVTIGRSAMVGAGAIVIKDVEEFSTVVGNPARSLAVAKRSKFHE
jgi:acetyltransferase-like isoleucine patch superfamily enzyme